MKYGFGVDLGGTTVKIGFFNERGVMQGKWEIPTRTAERGRHILPDIAASIRQHLDKTGIPDSDILGIGIGVPGPVDPKGNVNKCVNLGWGVFNLHQALSTLTGFPVKGGNDANVAALGEYWMGGGMGSSNMVFATLGTGVGGGIIVGGELIHGYHGSGGEIGHIVLDKNEPEACGCGKHGCAEQYCSATGVVRVAERYLAAHPEPSALRDIFPLTCKDVFDASATGDRVAAAILEQVYDYLGQFLADICCVIDPEVVVLGGGVSKAGLPLLDGARRYFNKYVFHAAKGARFALASLGNDAGTYGAFKLALNEFGKD